MIRSKNGARVVLGINAYSHDAGAALFVDGKLVFAAEEERYDRVKHSAAFPHGAIAAACDFAGIEPRDIEAVAFCWRRDMAVAKKAWYVIKGFPRTLPFLRERPEGYDVADQASVDAFARSVEPQSVDLLINNAGILQGMSLDALDVESIRRQFEVNALGPLLVTPDEIADPYDLDMTCTVTRGDQTTFSGACSTDKLRRKFEELVEYLLRSNSVPTPTVLLTGTGIIVTEEAALQPGDVTTIEIDGFGKLSNPAAVV